MILLRKTGKIYPNTYPMGTRCDKNKNVNYITILGKLIKITLGLKKLFLSLKFSQNIALVMYIVVKCNKNEKMLYSAKLREIS